MRFDNPESRILITIEEDGENIVMIVLYPCTDPQCPEKTHEARIDTFEEAGKFMQSYADKFLFQAPVKGCA